MKNIKNRGILTVLVLLARLMLSQNSQAQALNATVVSYQQVNLSWEKFAHTNNLVQIEYKWVGIHSSFNALATFTESASGTQTYQDKSVSGGVQIAYRLKYFVAPPNSTVPVVRYSDEVTVNTPVAPPPAPTNLTITGKSTTEIALSWSWNGGKDAAAIFVVERSDDGGGSYTPVYTSGYLENNFKYTNGGLKPGTNYCYRVKARWQNVDSGYSNTACSATNAGAPNAPSALIAKANQVFQIQLNWIDGSDNETGFEIERSNDNNSFSKIATVGANVTQFLDGPLTQGTRYYYRVRAINAAGVSGYTNVASDITNQSPPGAPQALTASVVNAGQINLTWRDVSDNEESFELERSTDGTSFSKVADIGSNTSTFENTGLNPRTKYWYRIRAKNSGGYSGYSNVADATTPDIAPNTPQNLNASPVSNTQIDLNWADNSGNETGFELERSTNGTDFTKLADLPANAATYQNTGLTTLTKYWYRIRAKNNIGNSDYSNVADATTFDVPPSKPESLTATTISSSQINLSWNDRSTNETGFQLERSTDGTSFNKIADLGSNITAYQNTGLTPATKYWYRVRAVNTANPSEFSNVASATTIDIAPLAPENLNASAVNYQQINLSWTDVSKNESGFEIERSIDGKTFAKIGEVATNSSTYIATGLKQLTRYYFRVKAINPIGSSPYSNVAEASTPKAPIPDAPQNLVAMPVDFDLVRLNWSALSANATDVVIERSMQPDTNFVQIGIQAASILEFADREILAVNDYYYRIKAKNPAGSSGYSNVAKVLASDIITGTEPAVSENQVYSNGKTLYVKLMKPTNALLTLYEKSGRKYKQFATSQFSETSLENLTPGIYIVVIETEKQLIKQKILVL
jgi:hypothetical protein